MSSTPGTPSSWTLHDSNLVLHQCLSTRKPAIPNEIILQILEDPSRWIRTRVIHARLRAEQEPLRISSNLQNRGDMQILATNPLSEREIRGLRNVVYTFRSRDQGWSSEANQYHGTYEHSWTWFEAGLTRPIDSSASETEREHQLQIRAAKEGLRYDLQRNRHAGSDPENYRHELGRYHELLQRAEDGDSVVLWARASFPGWENRVYNARIEVWCSDDLAGVMNSTAQL